MSCWELATTGSGLVAPLILAAACLVVGVIAFFVARTRRSRTAAAGVFVVLLSGGLTSGMADTSSARAAAPDCSAAPSPSAGNSLTITQTSTMSQLAPALAPAAITGLVVNTGSDSTYITAIVVSIVSVTKSPGAGAGICDASDYVLRDVTMPVDRMLEPGGSATFDGASIGFRDKSINQDACQGAAIGLRYVSS